jgi:hypothetical protein
MTRRRRHGTPALAAALTIAAAATAAAPPARAYVHRLTKDGAPVAWNHTCVDVTSYPGDFVSMMSADEIQNAAGGAAAAWSSAVNACTNLAISMTASTDTPPLVVPDGQNSIIYRTSLWCEVQADGTCAADIGPYERDALALTTLTVNQQTGVIASADIEVNAVNHVWADLVAHPELFAANNQLQDLQNALTHEMGHLIGLDHTCIPSAVANPPLDNLGNPVPVCGQGDASIMATTMYPNADPGTVDKRTLAPDDQQGVCDIYPAANPIACMAPAGGGGGCGCAAAGRPAAEAGLGLLAGAALLAVAGARGRARRRTP